MCVYKVWSLGVHKGRRESALSTEGSEERLGDEHTSTGDGVRTGLGDPLRAPALGHGRMGGGEGGGGEGGAEGHGVAEVCAAPSMLSRAKTFRLFAPFFSPPLLPLMALPSFDFRRECGSGRGRWACRRVI